MEARDLRRDEVILLPPRTLFKDGPAYLNTIRLSDGRYFLVTLRKVDPFPPLLRFTLANWRGKKTSEKTAEKRKEKTTETSPNGILQVNLSLDIVGGTGVTGPHYRGSFLLEGRLYLVVLFVRRVGERKALYLRLDSIPLGEAEEGLKWQSASPAKKE
jgi:hypothetical protein